MASVARGNGIELCLIYTTVGGPVLQGAEARRDQIELLDRFLDTGDAMECKMLKVTAGRLANNEYKDDEGRIVADWLAEASDHAAQHETRLAAEIHFGQYCETVAMARRICDLVDRPNFGLIHDAGNLHITNDIYGEDSVKVLGDKIFHVHIKDMVHAAADDEMAHDYLRGRFKRALLNDGDVDHLPLFKALKRMGYSGYLSCEASGGDDPIAVARHELAEVRKLLGQN